MKFRILLLFFLIACTTTYTQNIIYIDSFPQPSDITEVYDRADIDISSLRAFRTEPGVLIFENAQGVLQMAANDNFNFSSGRDDWRIWDLDFDVWGWTCQISDTAELTNNGSPELVITWQYDEPFGMGWRGGHHKSISQIWDVDSAKILLGNNKLRRLSRVY